MDIQNLLNSIQIIYNRKESINTLINPSLYDDIKNSLNNSLTDEQKHNDILAQMEDIKSGIYPYA